MFVELKIKMFNFLCSFLGLRSRSSGGNIHSWHKDVVINNAEKISYPMMYHNAAVGVPNIPTVCLIIGFIVYFLN